MDFSAYGGASAEWLAVEATLPAQTTGQTVLERQKTTNAGREAIAAAEMVTLGSQVEVRDHSVPTRDGSRIEARSYRPLSLSPLSSSASPVSSVTVLPVYMHLHGGGFIFGTLASEDAICARLALDAAVVVLNVNYRHTPQVVYPTAWHDAEDALAWLHEHMTELGGDAQRVVVGGISAGAQLTASMVLRRHGLPANEQTLPPIAGQVLMIPCTVHLDCYGPQSARLANPQVSSYVENAGAPILPLPTIRFFLDLLQAGPNPDTNNTVLNPGNATPQQVRGLPPTTFGICGLDPLRDEGLLYAKLLADEGVPTDIHLFKGVPHGFRRFGSKLSLTRDWDEVMAQGIQWTLSQPKATPFAVKVHSTD